jgi:hypothetical protein
MALSLLHKSQPVDKERWGLSSFQDTREPFDVIGRGNHSHDRRQGMDQLACKETERDKRLYEEYGRRREAAIGEEAGKAIQQCEIFRREPAVLPTERERMGEAAAQAAP